MDENEIDMNAEIQTNMGRIPVRDYLEIKASQNGFDSYAEMKAAGYSIIL